MKGTKTLAILMAAAMTLTSVMTTPLLSHAEEVPKESTENAGIQVTEETPAGAENENAKESITDVTSEMTDETKAGVEVETSSEDITDISAEDEIADPSDKAVEENDQIEEDIKEDKTEKESCEKDAADADESIVASGTCGNPKWTLYDDGTLDISGSSVMSDYSDSNRAPWYDYRGLIKKVTIGTSVWNIGAEAFYDCGSLEEIDIPSGGSFCRIGRYAFEKCTSLKTIEIPDGYIDQAAFCYCTKLETVVLPGSIKSISDWTFFECTSLKNISIPGSVTSIGEYAFSYCSSLRTVVLPSGVSEIGASAFTGCTSLNEFIIPTGVASIEEETFYNCVNLKYITIPYTVNGIGNDAFTYCNNLTIKGYSGTYAQTYAEKKSIPFESLTCEHANTEIRNSKEATCIDEGYSGDTYCTECGTKILTGNTTPATGVHTWNSGEVTKEATDTEDGVLTYTCTICGATKSESIPADETIIASGTCGEELIWLLNDNGVLTIRGTGRMYDYKTISGYSAHSSAPWYDNSSNIKSVIVENGVTSIGNYAFYDFNYIASVTLSAGLTDIGNYAFFGCYKLTSIIIPEGVTTIGDYVFYCGNLTSIKMPETLKNIGDYAFYYCDFSSVTIPESVESIGARAFYCCTNLNSIVIPKNVTSIGECVLGGYSKITSINVASGNTVYDSRNNCNAIIETATNTLIAGCATTTIPNDVTHIGNYAFYDCTSLTNIIIPKGVTSIGDYAFGCTNLTDIELPESLTSIGDAAFCCNLTNVIIPDSVTSIGSYAFCGCDFTNIVIPKGISTIEKGMFQACSQLKYVTIPSNITVIGDDAFNYCNSISDVYYGGDNTNWSNVSISSGNDSLTVATLHLDCSSCEHNNTEVRDAVKETCGAGGYTGDTYCNDCGVKLSKGEIIPATGEHSWNAGEVTKQATCVTEGVKQYTCSVCQATKTETIAIDSTNHAGGTETKDAKEPTCGEAGYTGDTYCKGCGAKLSEGEAIPATGEHTWDGGKVTKAATETSTGIMTYTCSICGETKTSEIPRKGEFSDIASCTSGVQTAITWAADNSIVSGYSDGTFRPTENCTRQQMVIMLWRLAGKPSPKSLDSATKFTDTADLSSGSKTAIAWAVEKGIVSGYSDGTFQPTAEVTRLQTVIMLWRMAGKPTPSSTSANFTDISGLSANSQKAIYWAAENGITKGTKQTDGSYLFAPNDPCQRQHIATFVYRYAQKY